MPIDDKVSKALIEEIIVDCYEEHEFVGAFGCAIEDNLEIPFRAKILGIGVLVTKIRYDGFRISAKCKANGKEQDIDLLDLKIEGYVEGIEFIKAYRSWREI